LTLGRIARVEDFTLPMAVAALCDGPADGDLLRRAEVRFSYDKIL
jgi:hypothetical protein